MANGLTGLALLLIFAVTAALKKGELLDMSYEFYEGTQYYPGLGFFEFTVQHRGPFGDVPWLEKNALCAPEHGGTHMDAPSHFAEGRMRINDIPLSRLVGPAVRVDISEKAKVDRDYAVTVKDLQDWEEVYGKIPDGSLLFVFSGWGAFYSDRLAFFGSARNDTYLNDQGESLLHYPGVSPEAATWLVANRNISGLGIDTASLDIGPSTVFMAHQILLGANIFGIEMVANLDKLPNTGAKVQAFPMKIKDGSGAPARVVASLDDDSISGAAMLSAEFAICGSVVAITNILIMCGCYH